VFAYLSSAAHIFSVARLENITIVGHHNISMCLASFDEIGAATKKKRKFSPH
jgi:hypothetical protein